MAESDATKLPTMAQSSYETWSVIVKAYLRKFDCLEAVEEPQQGVESDPRKNERAFNVLVSTLETKDNDVVLAAKNNARALWEILARNYKPIGSEHREKLVAAWSSMELKRGESITDYYYRFVVLLKHLKAAGVNTDDGMNKITYLKGLPDTYGMQRVMYDSDLRHCSLKQINVRILAQEKRLSESSRSEFAEDLPGTRSDYSDLSLGSVKQMDTGIMAQEKRPGESGPSRSELLKSMPDAGGEPREMDCSDLSLANRENVNAGTMTQDKKVSESSPSRSEFQTGMPDTGGEQREMDRSDPSLASDENVDTGINMTQEEKVSESSPSRSEFQKGLPDTDGEQREMDCSDLSLRSAEQMDTEIMVQDKMVSESRPSRSEFPNCLPDTHSEPREIDCSDPSVANHENVNTGIMTQDKKVSESSASPSEFAKGLSDTQNEQREVYRGDLRPRSHEHVNTGITAQEQKDSESGPSRSEFPKGLPDKHNEPGEMYQGQLRLGSLRSLRYVQEVNSGIMIREKQVSESSGSRSELLKGLADTRSEQREMDCSELRLGSLRSLQHIQGVNTGIMTPEKEVSESGPSRSEFLKGLADTSSEHGGMNRRDVRLGSVEQLKTRIVPPEKILSESSPSHSEPLRGLQDILSEQNEMCRSDLTVPRLPRVPCLDQVNTGILPQEKAVGERSPSRSAFLKGLAETNREHGGMHWNDLRLGSPEHVKTGIVPPVKKLSESSPSRPESLRGLLETPREQKEMCRSDLRLPTLPSLDRVDTGILPHGKRLRECSSSRYNAQKRRAVEPGELC